MIKTIFHINIGRVSVAEPIASDESAQSFTPSNKRIKKRKKSEKKKKNPKSLNFVFKNASIFSVSMETQASQYKPMTPDDAC